MKKLKPEHVVTALLFVAVVVSAGINVFQNLSVDQSKLPEKVEESKGFQRWITNLKNKDLDYINADDFTLIEENEIYNTKWLKVYSLDEPGKQEEFDTNIKAHLETKGVAYSPSEQVYVDYRNIQKDGYKANEAHLYGLRDDKILDSRILDCSTRANCYFDRAYFLSNDVFVITEFSRTIDNDAAQIPECDITSVCNYSVKLHLIDLINNKRLVYESKPFDLLLSETIPEL